MLRPIRRFWTLAALALLGVAPVQAGMITVSNVNTDDIVIPVFDTSLGTLTAVQLQVTLLAGTTSSTNNHDHATYQLRSTNGFPTIPSGTPPLTSGSVVSSGGGVHVHGITTANYSAGSLDVGNFSFSTNPGPAHSHRVDYHFAFYSIGSALGYRAHVTMDTEPSGAQVSSYNGATKNLSYSGPDMTPFLGPSDIVIAAGLESTSTSGAHTHSVNPFSVMAGSLTWHFEASTLPSADAHTHTYDPRFTTVATFFYDEIVAPVPEPASLALCGLGALGLVCGARRRRSTTPR